MKEEAKVPAKNQQPQKDGDQSLTLDQIMAQQERDTKKGMAAKKQKEAALKASDPLQLNYIRPAAEDIYKKPQTATAPVKKVAAPAKKDQGPPSIYANLEDIMKEQFKKK